MHFHSLLLPPGNKLGIQPLSSATQLNTLQSPADSWIIPRLLACATAVRECPSLTSSFDASNTLAAAPSPLTHPGLERPSLMELSQVLADFPTTPRGYPGQLPFPLRLLLKTVCVSTSMLQPATRNSPLLQRQRNQAARTAICACLWAGAKQPPWLLFQILDLIVDQNPLSHHSV